MTAFGFELPHHRDDLLLRAFHFLDLDGAEGVHVLAQHFRAALAHRLQHMILHLFAGALQGDGQDLAVHLGEHLLEGVDVEQQQVLEDEHQVANGLHQGWIGLLDGFQNLLAGIGIEAIEHLRDRVHAAVRFAAQLAQVFQLGPDDRGDFGDDLGRDLVKAGHAQGHVGAQLAGSENSRPAAWEGFRCERISAMVWGCSLWMNLASCCGSVLRSASKLSVSLPSVFIRRSSIFLAASGPKALISILRA